MIRARAPRITLIDGPSGAGKSELADRLRSLWPLPERPELIRMDDIYPGWEGLEAASEQIAQFLVEPLAAGEPGSWRSFDWSARRPGEWHRVAADTPVLLEGCGCLTARTAPYAGLSIWLSADDAVRKERALRRDRGAFDPYWDLWQRQYEEFLDREHPVALADMIVDGT